MMPTEYYVFGDESIAGNIILYALVIVPLASIKQAELALSKIKEEFGASSSARIHCKELLHEDARKNTEWAHLNSQQAWDLILSIKDNLANLGLLTRAGYVDKRDHSTNLLGLHNEIDLANDKQLIPYAFLASVSQLALDNQYAGLCKLWIDPNKDMIRWFNGNAQVGRLLKLNIADISEKSIDTVMTPENLITKEKPPLLDLADLLAYCSSRVLNNAQKATKYKSDLAVELIYKTMNPQIAKYRQANQDEAVYGEFRNFSVNLNKGS